MVNRSGDLHPYLWKRIISQLILLMVFSCQAVCQTYTKEDSTKIYSLLSMADNESISGSLDDALRFADEAWMLSRKKRMMRGEGFSSLKVADVMLHKDSTGNITHFFNEAIRIGTQLKDSFMLALANYQLGQYAMRNDRLNDATGYFNKSLSLRFEKAQNSYTAFVYNDIGYVHGLIDEFEKEAYWYLKALRIHEKLEYLEGVATATHNLGSVYAKLGNADKAFEYTREAIAMREKLGDVKGLATCYESLSRLFWNVSLDSASKYQQVAMGYAEKTGLTRLMIKSYDNLSVLMDRRRNKPEALMYIRKSIKLCEEMDDKVGLANKYRWAALLSGDIKDTASAEEYFDKSYSIARQLNNKALLRDYHGTRASYYRRANDFLNAFESQKLYYTYRDSLVSEETETNIIELQTKYETEKKDNEISRLNTEQRIRQLEIEKQRATIAGNKLEALQKENEILLLSQRQQLQDNRIKQQQEELEKQVLLAKNNSQALLLASQDKKLKEEELAGQKKVRNFIILGAVLLSIITVILFNRYKLKKRLEQQNQLLMVRNDIARDLHDEIGSTLTSIKILSEVSRNNFHKDTNKASMLLTRITEQSSQMQQGMSDIVWAIKPDNDKFENMLVRMREFASHTLENRNIIPVFQVDEKVLSQSLDMQQRRDIFLIYKEAINNAAKYSKATRVEIKLMRIKDELSLTIKDNGVGFELKEEFTSNGLKNMKSRTESMSGVFSLITEPGSGTQINARFPAT
jgi:signal transduction histidine kinase